MMSKMFGITGKTQQSKETSSRPRLYFLDEVRGVVILLMVFYHLMFDLVYLFRVPAQFFASPVSHWMQRTICCTFIFLAGVMTRFSRNNFKRGCFCFAMGLLMSLGTLIFQPGQLIWFGILHMLGISMMLFVPARLLLDRLSPAMGWFLCLLLFFITFDVPWGSFGVDSFGLSFSLPSSFYSTQWLFWLGFPSSDFFSGDYFPLVPWFFLFLCGSCAGVYLKEGKYPSWFVKSHCPPLGWLGRHSMFIYLLHQPVMYGILTLLFMAG